MSSGPIPSEDNSTTTNPDRETEVEDFGNPENRTEPVEYKIVSTSDDADDPGEKFDEGYQPWKDSL